MPIKARANEVLIFEIFTVSFFLFAVASNFLFPTIGHSQTVSDLQKQTEEICKVSTFHVLSKFKDEELIPFLNRISEIDPFFLEEEKLKNKPGARERIKETLMTLGMKGNGKAAAKKIS